MEVERIACHGDHRARRRIKIHSVEAVFPEDILDVLGVAIGWIFEKRFFQCSPTGELLLHEVGKVPICRVTGHVDFGPKALVR
jgi:hypothetical protein